MARPAAEGEDEVDHGPSVGVGTGQIESNKDSEGSRRMELRFESTSVALAFSCRCPGPFRGGFSWSQLLALPHLSFSPSYPAGLCVPNGDPSPGNTEEASHGTS